MQAIAEKQVLAKALVLASAGVTLVLGSLHLLYTHTRTQLVPRDPAVQQAMAATHMGITRETTVWQAWVGFNASHSAGILLFSLVFGYLAAAQPELLFRSTYLQAVGLAMLVALLVLARAYWFSVPLMGAGFALACFAAGVAMGRS